MINSYKDYCTSKHMKNLIKKINKLKQDDISKVINARIKEFESIKHPDDIFSELCFCLLTANFQAKKSWEIQKELDNEFKTLSERKLAKKLKVMGHRFWPQRAERIVLVRKQKYELIEALSKESPREWIIKNIKGLGMKESSHFLRNIGHKDYAIIDFHIVDLLVAEKLIEKPKTITPKKYLEIESVLEELSKAVGLTQSELDLYLWYMETGTVLK